ncbi:hypothetical protein BOX15_Mlig023382g1 [Macrostomum lignano]|uniref:Sphingomyelin synthase-like domain-containing protein n=1 Tax=Macrostomum lignano TaxID=282301 RepID=A0A267EMK5_9PLAT|nr:hypothetical protein BOX15_Mlig023382g1 [Macrostomum lignano]
MLGGHCTRLGSSSCSWHQPRRVSRGCSSGTMTATAAPATGPDASSAASTEPASTSGEAPFQQSNVGYCKQCSDALIDFSSNGYHPLSTAGADDSDEGKPSATLISMPTSSRCQASNGCEDDVVEESALEELAAKPPSDFWRAFLALLFMFTGMTMTAVSLIFVHERVPSSPPLPDVLLTRVTHIPWALDVCEYLLIVTLAATYITAFLHRHRWVVLRRIFFMIGMLFSYRSVTIFVTALPNPSPTYYCEPKQSGSLGFEQIFARLLRLGSGGGFSINGNHVYCGDYIFSGHTAILTLGYLVIREYTSPRLTVLHWTSWIVSLTGVGFLVLSHGHYTIDIVLGYWITTRLWWMYHTAANFAGQRTHGYFRQACWWRAFLFFEADRRYSYGPLPYEFDLPWPTRIRAAAAAAHQLARCRHSAAELAAQTCHKLGLL